MSLSPQLLAFGMLFIFGLIILVVARASRREKLELDNQLKQLGFEALASVPTGLERRLADLYDPSGKKDIKVRRVYHRRDYDQELYLFDSVDSSGDGSEIGTEVFGVISSQLALPRFSLITLPDFDRNSLVGGLINKLLEKVMSFAEGHLQLERVEFPGRPDLDDRLVAFGQDPTVVKEMLDRVGMTRIQNAGMLQIAGSGDLLTVDFSTDSNFNQAGQDLASRYQSFIEISRRFRD